MPSGIEITTDLDFLLPELRFRLGDIDPTAYRYLDSWLRVALVTALKALQRWWRIKYLIDETTYVVTRYSESTFLFDEPPVIQQQDQIPILIMATILVKDGSLENSAWRIGSWRDAEISVSNIESGKLKDASLERMWQELLWYLKPPMKKLTSGYRDSIPGADEY
jgi:hypothetical protein